jgi:hypothetical protein
MQLGNSHILRADSVRCLVGVLHSGRYYTISFDFTSKRSSAFTLLSILLSRMPNRRSNSFNCLLKKVIARLC